jgi:hypothetical protein
VRAHAAVQGLFYLASLLLTTSRALIDSGPAIMP